MSIILGEEYDEFYGFPWDRESEDWRGCPEEPEDLPEIDEDYEIYL